MKILVYGAGVLGCTLAHQLILGKQDVTLLARGTWKETLLRDGLVIRHWAQMRTTRDQVHVVDALPPQEEYDLIFVVMQFGQLDTILPILKQNCSRHIVFVGNNPCAERAYAALCGEGSDKQVAFGFQGTGGRRENGRVVSIYTNIGMTVGALHGTLDPQMEQRLRLAFAQAKYRLSFHEDMDTWLKCHLTLILPACYICYTVDCHLPRATKAQRVALLDAALEACGMLRTLGLPIGEEENDDFYRPGKMRRMMAAMVFVLCKTPIGKLAASDHCRHAVEEMRGLDQAFEALRAQAGVKMPVWDQLRTAAMPVLGADEHTENNA